MIRFKQKRTMENNKQSHITIFHFNKLIKITIILKNKIIIDMINF